MTLRKVEEIHETTKGHPTVYKGCLSVAERKLMAEIYKEARIKPIRLSKCTFGKYRKEWI